MKTIIIRKPKFMRNDVGMKDYLNVAGILSKEANRSELTLDQQVTFLKEAGECLNKAAKAGGFFSVGDMHKWLTTH